LVKSLDRGNRDTPAQRSGPLPAVLQKRDGTRESANSRPGVRRERLRRPGKRGRQKKGELRIGGGERISSILEETTLGSTRPKKQELT